MEASGRKDQWKKKATQTKAIPIPFESRALKESISITTDTLPKTSREQIINQAFRFHKEGNIIEAAKYYQHFINQGFEDHRVFSNYGIILKDLGKLQEAELSLRKAIQLNPNFANAYFNLGLILKDLNKLDESIYCYEKAIELKKDYKNAIAEMGITMTLQGNYKEGLQKIKEGYGSIIFDHITPTMTIEV